MGNISTRTKGKVDELTGRAKAAVGRVIGNERMHIEGTAKRLKGEATQQAAKAKERVQGSVEQAKGRLQKGVGGVLDQGRRRAEGTVEELTGVARRRINK